MSLSSPTAPTVPWQETMAKLAQRHTDTQAALTRLDIMLAGGLYTANQLRRAEEDVNRTFALFVSALIESYPSNER